MMAVIVSCRPAVVALALSLAPTPAFARDVSPLTDAGAATAGLIKFYGDRCGRHQGYFLTRTAFAFIATAARAKPSMVHAGYTTEAHMPTQSCAGAYEHNIGPRGVVSTAVGFAIMRSKRSAAE